MKSYLLETSIGYYIFDDKGNLLSKINFLKDSEEFGKIILKISQLEVPTGLEEFGNQLNNLNVKEIITENKEMRDILSKITDKPVSSSIYDPIFKKLRSNFPKLLEQISSELTEETLITHTKLIAEKVTKEGVKESSEQDDVHIKHIIESFEDTVKFINVYSVRLREWYGVHFPELTDNLVSDSKLYALIVDKLGKKENITTENLQNELAVREEYANEIGRRVSNSMGSDIDDQILNSIQNLSKQIINLFELKNQLEKDLDFLLKPSAPNLQKILGSQLAGKLITHAGGLRSLALMPSSTIQVLGAEKALFRSLKTNKDSPKHGIIFTWPNIRGAKYWHRGKISRLLAGKIAIASKIDFFKGEFIGDKILAELEQKIAEIKERFPKPPEKVEEPEDIKRMEASDYSRMKKNDARGKRKNLSKSKYKTGAKSGKYNKNVKRQGRRN
ncbi:MAG: hypothetical protein GY870_21195 [archaeon]|nr:hypothetical protein [archaeon]